MRPLLAVPLLAAIACSAGSPPRRITTDDSADVEDSGDTAKDDDSRAPSDSGDGADDSDTGTVDDTDTDDTGTQETDTDGTDDTDDTDIVELLWNEGAFSVDWRDAIDCGTSGRIGFSFETHGEGIAALYIVETRPGQTYPWSEFHTLPMNGIGTDWGLFERHLTTGATLQTQTSDVNTLFTCGTTASLNPLALGTDFRSALYVALWRPSDAAALGDANPANDPAPSDCIAFGHDVTGGYTVNPIAQAAARPIWVHPTVCRTLAPTSP
ncbi:MAG: hypothetical protein H6732_19405 [Alphaproteobacteria bacterium]|nr:hypothetical protein [Alphaproteobacteria bacterium]